MVYFESLNIKIGTWNKSTSVWWDLRRLQIEYNTNKQIQFLYKYIYLQEEEYEACIASLNSWFIRNSVKQEVAWRGIKHRDAQFENNDSETTYEYEILVHVLSRRLK